ncbi:hypothetical protein ACFOOJ_06400 [Sphingobium xenophagum]|nr:hypothetical protein [Sphingobium xenophagum]
MTRIGLPGANPSIALMDYGEMSCADMIAQLRTYADHLRAKVNLIDAAADGDFQIDVIRGPYVQHHVRELQKSAISARAAKGAVG